MKSHKLQIFGPLLVLCLLFIVAGCGGSGVSGSAGSSSGTGSIAVSLASAEAAKAAVSTQNSVVKAGALASDIVTVRFSVSGPGMTTMNMDFPAAAGKGLISGIPVGSGRILLIQGLDLNGLVIFMAEVPNIVVQEGLTSDVGTVILNSVNPVTPTNVFTTAMLSGKTFTYVDTNSNSGTVTFNADGTSTGLTGTWTINTSGQLVMRVTSSGNTATFTLASINGTAITASESVSNGTTATVTFTATSTTSYSISGKVLVNGAGLAGVTVSAGSYLATTQADGSYTINGAPNGAYTLTASKTGYSITPASTQVTVNNANLANQNFTATLTPNSFDISGSITLNGTGLSGVTVSAGSYSATTLASGTYTISGVPNGSYTLTPAKSGYSFSPASASVTVSSANITGQNFTATASGGGATGSSAYFPTTVGNSWTYETNDGTNTTPYTNAITKASGSTFTLQTTHSYSMIGTVTTDNNVSIINGAYYTTSLSSINSWSDGSTSGTSTVTGAYTAPGSMLLPGEMASGVTTSSSTTGTLNSTSTSGTYSSSSTTISEESGSYTVAGTESVTVPAGTFPAALKINYTRTIKQTTTTSGSTSSSIYTSTTTGTYWYVSGIGWVKSTGTGTGTMTINGETTTSTSSSTSVLKSYNVK